MKDYQTVIADLENQLKAMNCTAVQKQLYNAQLMGATLGEKVSIISSMLKTYEISNPEFFTSLGPSAQDMYEICRYAVGEPSANFDLLNELNE